MPTCAPKDLGTCALCSGSSVQVPSSVLIWYWYRSLCDESIPVMNQALWWINPCVMNRSLCDESIPAWWINHCVMNRSLCDESILVMNQALWLMILMFGLADRHPPINNLFRSDANIEFEFSILTHQSLTLTWRERRDNLASLQSQQLEVNQSWALPVFFHFFNNKKLFFCTFYQVNNLFLRQSYLKSPLPIKLTW